MRSVLPFLLACGGAPVDPAQPAADPAPCAEVARRELQLMSVGFLGAQRTGALEIKLEGRCHDDAWPVDARRCVVTAASFDEMGACQDRLTSGQRAAFHRDIAGSDDIPDQPSTPPPPELLK